MLPEITRRYLEPHRHYHTLDHPVRMLREGFAYLHKDGVCLSDEQVWAIWLHDLVYVPGAADNEERSAEEGLELLDWHDLRDMDKAATIQRIILDTKDHVPQHPMSPLVIDLDLHGFADSWMDYVEASSLVRQEFGFVSGDPKWVAGRIEFLRKMEKRSPFFLTGWFRVDGDRAMENIRRELFSYTENP